MLLSERGCRHHWRRGLISLEEGLASDLAGGLVSLELTSDLSMFDQTQPVSKVVVVFTSILYVTALHYPDRRRTHSVQPTMRIVSSVSSSLGFLWRTKNAWTPEIIV